MNSQDIVSQLYDDGYLVTQDVMKLIEKGYSYESIKSLLEKEVPAQTAHANASIEILKSYKDAHTEITTQDFISHFTVRLEKLSAMLKRRTELENVQSINRIATKTESEKLSVIGFVKDKTISKNEHIILTIEDKTGDVRALVLKKEGKEELYKTAKNVMLDEVIGLSGTLSDGNDKVIFTDAIIFPDIPLGAELKKCPDDVCAVFIGDLHIGSKVFLKKDFTDFIEWLKGNSPDPKLNELSKKVQYVFVVGDIIEGAGIYPNQEHDLEIMLVREQYKEAAKWFAQIPSHLKIIICPGNHDTMRLSEPQPPLSKEYAEDLLNLPNITNVSSPSYITMHKTDVFPGFTVLLYHGYSFFYYIDNVEEIRQAGGINRIDLVMEYLLRRRHLAPSHTSNLYIPDKDRDELIVDPVPDFFITGHIHKSVVKNFRNITLLNCSCFTDITEYQKKQGMTPDLSKVAVMNLKTRDIKVLDFHE